MSPEQVRGDTTDHRADVFAVGAVLYEMLAGRRAFTAKTTVETMNAILNHEPRRSWESRPRSIRSSGTASRRSRRPLSICARPRFSIAPRTQSSGAGAPHQRSPADGARGRSRCDRRGRGRREHLVVAHSRCSRDFQPVLQAPDLRLRPDYRSGVVIRRSTDRVRVRSGGSGQSRHLAPADRHRRGDPFDDRSGG